MLVRLHGGGGSAWCRETTADSGQNTVDSLDEVAEVEKGHERDDPQICGDRVRSRLRCRPGSRRRRAEGSLDAPSRQTSARSSSSVHRTSCRAKAPTSSSESTAASNDFSLFSFSFAFLSSAGTSAAGPAGPVGGFSSSCDIVVLGADTSCGRRAAEHDGRWRTEGEDGATSIWRLLGVFFFKERAKGRARARVVIQIATRRSGLRRVALQTEDAPAPAHETGANRKPCSTALPRRQTTTNDNKNSYSWAGKFRGRQPQIGRQSLGNLPLIATDSRHQRVNAPSAARKTRDWRKSGFDVGTR